MDIELGKVIDAILIDLSIDEITDLFEEIVDKMEDQDLLNNVYELFKRKHEEWLDNTNLSEEEYQYHYADPTIYPDAKNPTDEEEDDNEDGNTSVDERVTEVEEPWITEVETDEEDDENVMDVFSTD